MELSMAGEIIRPSDLPERETPVGTEIVPSDNGSVVGGVTWIDGVNAARPFASQAQAEAGANSTVAMSPLTTKQAIDAQVPGKITTAINGLNLSTMSQQSASDYTKTADLADVALSGSYDDLDDKPTLGDLAAKDAVETSDIDATGTASASTYLRGDGTWADLEIGAAPVVAQCRLVFSSPNVVLMPVDGDKLSINGTIRAIPGAGVSLAPTGLTPSTLYYVYAYWTGSAIALEASTTGYSISSSGSTKWQAVKTGDATRALVGMVRPVTGPAFTDVEYQRFVASYYNRRRREVRNWLTSAVSKTATSASELNSGARIEFICWAGESLQASLTSSVFKAETGATYTGIGLDGATPLDSPVRYDSPNTNSYLSASHTASVPGLTEGYHYLTALGWVSEGTGSWIGAASAGTPRTILSTLLMA